MSYTISLTCAVVNVPLPKYNVEGSVTGLVSSSTTSVNILTVGLDSMFKKGRYDPPN